MRPGRGGGVVSVKLTGGAAGGGGAPPSLWRTPTPYIFLSLAFMMGLIALSLLVLICMRRKSSSSSSSSRHGGAAAADDEKKAAARALAPLDREPKVVVFMPGDGRAPSFLASAKPLVAPALAGDGGGGAGAAAAAV